MPGENGNGKGTFWKVVGTVAIALLAWIGTQLLVVPQHSYQLSNHETRISEVERKQAAATAATDELIGLLRAEQAERRRAKEKAR